MAKMSPYRKFSKKIEINYSIIKKSIKRTPTSLLQITNEPQKNHTMSAPQYPTIPNVITLTAKSKKAKESQLNRLRNAFQLVDSFTKVHQIKRFEANMTGLRKSDWFIDELDEDDENVQSQIQEFILKKWVYLTITNPVGHPV